MAHHVGIVMFGLSYEVLNVLSSTSSVSAG